MVVTLMRAVVFGLGVEVGREIYRTLKQKAGKGSCECHCHEQPLTDAPPHGGAAASHASDKGCGKKAKA